MYVEAWWIKQKDKARPYDSKPVSMVVSVKFLNSQSPVFKNVSILCFAQGYLRAIVGYKSPFVNKLDKMQRKQSGIHSNFLFVEDSV